MIVIVIVRPLVLPPSTARSLLTRWFRFLFTAFNRLHKVERGRKNSIQHKGEHPHEQSLLSPCRLLVSLSFRCVSQVEGIRYRSCYPRLYHREGKRTNAIECLHATSQGSANTIREANKP
jgi:hypothetical protein